MGAPLDVLLILQNKQNRFKSYTKESPKSYCRPASSCITLVLVLTLFILTSVSLAMTPVPLQGASNRTLSNPCMTWKWYEELIFKLLVPVYIQHLPLLCRGSGSASVYGRKDTFLLSFSNKLLARLVFMGVRCHFV